jgi:hypothetical protein
MGWAFGLLREPLWHNGLWDFVQIAQRQKKYNAIYNPPYPVSRSFHIAAQNSTWGFIIFYWAIGTLIYGIVGNPYCHNDLQVVTFDRPPDLLGYYA